MKNNLRKSLNSRILMLIFQRSNNGIDDSMVRDLLHSNKESAL